MQSLPKEHSVLSKTKTLASRKSPDKEQGNNQETTGTKQRAKPAFDVLHRGHTHERRSRFLSFLF